MFFGQCVPHDGVTVMPYSVDAGVEEIMGLDGIRPVREWCGYAFGLPDRHPTVVSLWRGLLPMRSSRDVRWMFGGTCGAWWFENWIVDASKRN